MCKYTVREVMLILFTQYTQMYPLQFILLYITYFNESDAVPVDR